MGRSRIVTPWERSYVRAELDRAATATKRAQAELVETAESVSHIRSTGSVDDADWDELLDLTDGADRQVETAVVVLEDLNEDPLLRTALGESAFASIGEVTMAAEDVSDAHTSLKRAHENTTSGAIDAATRELATAHNAIEQGRERVETVADAAISAKPPESTSERDWVDMIKDTIPIEVLGAWTFIAALVTATPGFDNDWYWAIFAVIVVATALHAFQNILLSDKTDETGVPEYVASLPKVALNGDSDSSADSKIATARIFARWSAVVHILLAVVAFVVWVYYLGGPFLGSDLHDPIIAAIALPLTVVAGPQLFYVYVWIPATIELWFRSRIPPRSL